MPDILDRSFLFGGVDIRQQFGVIVSEVSDSLQPSLRPRKSTIPNVSGQYDYGANAYDERVVTLDCGTLTPMDRDGMRELAHFLSRKTSIRLWKEPDRYYIGRLYDAAEIERVGPRLNRFALTFVCDPFAYGDPITIPVVSGENIIHYPGTAPTGFLLTLRNTSASDVVGLRVEVVHSK